MKVKKIILILFVAGILQFAFVMTAEAYYWMLPFIPPSPPLPYIAEADHFSGPASVQMILNTCPDVSSRNFHSQSDIYNSILLHNTEPTQWFSDPKGVEGVLEDVALSPCGNWIDYSHTNKSIVLGKILYYLKTQKYLTPVSISSNEHWVTVFGYQTDVEPTSSNLTVTLLDIYFYDPLPGNPSTCWKSGTVWSSNADYWGVPINKPGSSWHNKYIAVIEPPEISINVKVKKWILEGPILPIERIERYVYRWLEYVREKKLARGPFEVLLKDVKIEKPTLIKAAKYSYYLVPFKDRHMAAIFNAYDGSFEEFRYFQKPQKYVLDRAVIKSNLSEILRNYKAEVVEISGITPRYDPKEAPTARFSPSWEVHIILKDSVGKDYKVQLIMNASGNIIRGMDRLAEMRMQKKK
jgi:hypothetical protein